MIQLTLIGAHAEACRVKSSPYFRITGGIISTRPEEGPLATYAEGRWRDGEVLLSGMRFEGPCRLVFGLPCDPAGLSEELQSLAIDGPVLSAHGVSIAIYEPTRELWHDAGGTSWWHAFRVESVESRELPGQAPSAGRSTDPSQPLGDPDHENPTTEGED